MQRLAPLAQRLPPTSPPTPRFDNPRAVQIRLPGFDLDRARSSSARKVRDLYADGAQPRPDRRRRRRRLRRRPRPRRRRTLGGKVGVAPRLFLKKLVADVLDRVDQFADFDPRQHYALTVARRRAHRRRTQRRGRRRRRRRSSWNSTCERPSTGSHPALAAPHRQHPGLADAAPAAGSGRSRPLARRATTRSCSPRPPAARPRRRVFPLLSRDGQRAAGPALSVLYVCPLKALLNNLQPRLEALRRLARPPRRALARRRRRRRAGSAILRRAARHPAHHPRVARGDARRASTSTTAAFFAGRAGRRRRRGPRLRRRRPRLAPARRPGTAHPASPAGRSSGSACRPPSATRTTARLAAGLGTRTAGPGRVDRPRSPRVSPRRSDNRAATGEVELDYVGSARATPPRSSPRLHRGEKRLVFCDSPAAVEELGAALRERGVTTFLSHASLSADERRRAEQAFAEARDCVIVATSTLELGIDVGDLDRVIQIDAPATVASFLQRLGRTGRRPGTTRNCLFLALDDDGACSARPGCCTCGARRWVEPVSRPPEPRHIVAQQLLALCLQERQSRRPAVDGMVERPRHPSPPAASRSLAHLLERGLPRPATAACSFIGPEAENAASGAGTSWN